MNPSVNRSSDSPQSPAGQQQAPSEQTVNPPKPPNPPKNLVTSQSETTSQTVTPADTESATPSDTKRQQPIPPPSEPMQYRAIGLVLGQYMPSAEQFTRGTLLAADETLIDAVLLGRVMSLVKNHLDLSDSHLWVVYPRTRQEDGKLHVQIVGVWEPEHLTPKTPTDADESFDTDETAIAKETSPDDADLNDGYFSVRGEVIYQSRDEEEVVVKIRQAPRKELEKPKFFKLKLQGVLPEKMIGHFLDFQVHRQGDALVIQDLNDIGLLPSAKGKKPFLGKRPGGRKPFSSQRPTPKVDRSTPVPPPKRREPPPKPIRRQTPPQ